MGENSQPYDTIVEKFSKKSDSIIRQYQDIYVGSDSYCDLIKHEFIIILFSKIPGAIGFLLRKVFFKKLFGKIGKRAIIGADLTLRSPNKIYAGTNLIFDSNVMLDAKGEESEIEIGNNVFIGKNSTISCALSKLVIGHNVAIGQGSFIKASRGPVVLGSYVTIGAHTVIISGNLDYQRLDIPMMKQEAPAKGITIGDDVWIGVGVRIVDGVKIGKGCVIGTGVVVMKDIPDYTIVTARPPIFLGSRQQHINS